MQNSKRTEPSGVTGEALHVLVAKMANGDQSALAELYDLTCSRVYGLAITILRNQSDAEEVTLDSYQRLWRMAHRFDGTRGSVIGYLLITCRNLAIDRKRAYAARPSPVEWSRVDSDFAISKDMSPEEMLSLEELQSKVQDAVLSLSNRQKEVIDLAFLYGLTHHEISEQLGEPLGTVKGRIRSALAKLREALGGFYK